MKVRAFTVSAWLSLSQSFNWTQATIYTITSFCSQTFGVILEMFRSVSCTSSTLKTEDLRILTPYLWAKFLDSNSLCMTISIICWLCFFGEPRWTHSFNDTHNRKHDWVLSLTPSAFLWKMLASIPWAPKGKQMMRRCSRVGCSYRGEYFMGTGVSLPLVHTAGEDSVCAAPNIITRDFNPY